MEGIYDAMGTMVGSTSGNAIGQTVLNDQMGQVAGVFDPGLNGGGTWSDAMGHTVMSVQDTFMGADFHDSRGGFMGSATTDATGQTSFHDATSALTGTYDPMTGNMSNAIGQVTSSIR